MKSNNTARISEIQELLKDISLLKQEHFLCLSLSNKYEVVGKRTLFIGTLTGVMAHPREIFAAAIEDRAACIVVAHNHPSGDPDPSDDDITTTQQLAAAGSIMGIPLYDHIIVAGDKYFSFRLHGMLSR